MNIQAKADVGFSHLFRSPRRRSPLRQRCHYRHAGPRIALATLLSKTTRPNNLIGFLTFTDQAKQLHSYFFL